MQGTEQMTQLMTTVCPFCGVGCGLVVESGNAFPLRSHPITQGSLSLRGWSTGELLRSPLRVKSAFVRSPNGTTHPVEISEALKLIV